MTGEILRRNRELAVLNSVATTAAASLDLGSTLQVSLSSVVDAMNYNGGAVFLMDTSGPIPGTLGNDLWNAQGDAITPPRYKGG